MENRREHPVAVRAIVLVGGEHHDQVTGLPVRAREHLAHHRGEPGVSLGE
jgi:hypothetical protein